jgi:hypothetical protein
MKPRDEMLGLMDQSLLFLRGEGVDVSLGHRRGILSRNVQWVRDNWLGVFTHMVRGEEPKVKKLKC